MQEYERTVTTVANSFVRPKVERYVGNLQREISQRMRHARLRILRSDGGLAASEAAASTPVTLRGRTAAAAEPKETGEKRKSDPTEPQREAAKAVQNLSRRRLDSTERASRSLRQRASPSHTTCVLAEIR